MASFSAPAPGSATTIPKVGHIGKFLSNITDNSTPARVLLIGTSIASFNTSAVQVLAGELLTRYGSSGSVTMLGSDGGTYNAANGHVKQCFSGCSYTRLLLNPADPVYTQTGYGEKLVLVYSLESTGGSFTVSVDGAAAVTVTSLGTQAFNQEYVVSTTLGMHTIVITAPTTGIAYLERMEFLQNKAGIIVENGTMGGSSLANMVNNNQTITTGNVAPIPTVGDAGIDAHFNRTGVTKPDVIICQHFTNDGDEVLYATILTKAVAKTKANSLPLVLLDEQPALPFISAAGTLNANKTSIINSLQGAAAANPHVSYISWVGMVDFSDKTGYTNMYYPVGEVTHPFSIAHQIPLGPLLRLFVLPSSGYNNSQQSQYDQVKAAQKTSAVPALLPTVSGFVENAPYLTSALHSQTRQLVPVYAAAEDRSLVTNGAITNAAIAISATFDAYGPYIASTTASTEFVQAQPFNAAGSVFTIVVLARRTAYNASLKLAHDDSTAGLFIGTQQASGWLPGTSNTATVGTSSFLDVAPVYLVVQVKAVATTKSQINFYYGGLQVYGVWVVAGAVAKVPQLDTTQPRSVGLPLPLVVDLTVAQAIVGQTYLEVINGINVEKTPTTAYAYKGGGAMPLFRCLNKTAAGFVFMFPETIISTNAYDATQGGQTYVDTNNPRYYKTTMLAGFAAKKYTAALRLIGTTQGVRVYMYNGGSNTTLYLQADGTWAATSYVLADSIGVGNCTYAVTMVLSSDATLGTTPDLRIEHNTGTTMGIATFTPGVSACM